jgi:hypothetical protein
MLQMLSNEMTTGTSHFYNQAAEGEKIFRENTVAEDSFDWNLIFLRIN